MIMSTLDECGLSTDNIAGFSADNASSNFGSAGGGAYNLLKDFENPDIIKCNCFAHICHNTVKDMVLSLDADLEKFILRVYSHFSMSCLRVERLKEIYLQHGLEFLHLKKHVKTRWLTLKPAIDRILTVWEPLCKYFAQEFATNRRCVDRLIEELILLKPAETLVLLRFLAETLKHFDKANKKLQQKDICIIECYSIMKELDEKLLQTDAINMVMLNVAVDEDDRTNLNQKMIGSLSSARQYIKKYITFDHLNPRARLQMLELKPQVEESGLNLRFPTVTCFQLIVADYKIKNINFNALHAEINYIVQRFAFTLDFTDRTVTEKWTTILRTFPECVEIYKIMSFLLSLPVSSASSERVFSVMKAKLRDERSKLSDNMLKSELLISINCDMSCEEFFNDIKNDEELLKQVRSKEKY